MDFGVGLEMPSRVEGKRSVICHLFHCSVGDSIGSRDVKMGLKLADLTGFSINGRTRNPFIMI